MANFKGGYKIVSLQNNDLASNFTLEGLHDALANSYQKPILVEDIVISTEKKNDAYAVVNKSGTSYVIEVYNKILTVTTADAVTVTNKVEIDSIGEGLDLTDGELSATGGGGSIYLHAVYVGGKYNGNDYALFINLYSSNETAYTDLISLLTDLYNNASSHDNSSQLVISGGYVGSTYPAYIEIPTTAPTTTFGVGYFPDGKTHSLNPTTFASISTFRDNVIGV